MAKPIAYAARQEKGSDEHKRFTEAQKMMKQMSKLGPKNLMKGLGGMPGLGNLGGLGGLGSFGKKGGFPFGR